MVTRKVTIDGFARALSFAAPKMRRAMVSGARAAADQLVHRVVAEIRKRDIPDTHQLDRSVHWRPLPRGASVIVDAPHAPYVEYGTRPHRPPTEPLEAWAQRKLGVPADQARSVAWAIASKIAVYGTRPRGYFAAAMRDRRKIMRAAITEALRERVKL